MRLSIKYIDNEKNMKVQKKIYKCAVCGTENEYLDFDMKV